MQFLDITKCLSFDPAPDRLFKTEKSFLSSWIVPKQGDGAIWPWAIDPWSKPQAWGVGVGLDPGATVTFD